MIRIDTWHLQSHMQSCTYVRVHVYGLTWPLRVLIIYIYIYRSFCNLSIGRKTAEHVMACVFGTAVCKQTLCSTVGGSAIRGVIQKGSRKIGNNTDSDKAWSHFFQRRRHAASFGGSEHCVGFSKPGSRRRCVSRCAVWDWPAIFLTSFPCHAAQVSKRQYCQGPISVFRGDGVTFAWAHIGSWAQYWRKGVVLSGQGATTCS